MHLGAPFTRMSLPLPQGNSLVDLMFICGAYFFLFVLRRVQLKVAPAGIERAVLVLVATRSNQLVGLYLCCVHLIASRYVSEHVGE